MSDQSSNSTFETHDFSLACFLAAKGIPFEGLKPTADPRKFRFVFRRTPEITELVRGFWEETEKIEPMKLLNAQRSLKQRLHSDSYPDKHKDENIWEKS